MNNDPDLLKIAHQTAKTITQTDPHTAYRGMGRPYLFDLNYAFRKYINKQSDLDPSGLQKLESLLDSGFDAVATIATSALKSTNRIIKKDKALRIVNNHKTIESMGVIAHQEPGTAQKIVEQARSGQALFIVHYRDEYLSLPYPDSQSIHPYRKCPVVSSSGDKIIPSPIFQKFVAWSGSVAIHSMYKRRLTN